MAIPKHSVNGKEAKWREVAAWYLTGISASEAYMKASWTNTNAHSAASSVSRLFKNKRFLEILEEERAKQAERMLAEPVSIQMETANRVNRIRFTADEVARLWYNIATADVRDYFEWDNKGVNRIVPSEELTEEQAKVIKKFSYYETPGEHGTARRFVFELEPKMAALEARAKQLGMFKDVEKELPQNDTEAVLQEAMELLDSTRDRLLGSGLDDDDDSGITGRPED